MAVRDAAARLAWSARSSSPCSTSPVEESAQEAQRGREPAKSLELEMRSIVARLRVGDLSGAADGVLKGKFHRRLELSQYNLEASRRIMVAGLRGYERIRDKAVKEGGNINWSEEEGAEGHNKKKLLGKANWFKTTKERDQYQEKKRRWRRTGGT